jgi:predicted nucleic acid-binding protein
MNEIFIDSSALFAWSDAACPQNRAIHDCLLHEHPPLLTTNIIIAETISLITKRISKHAGIQFVEAVEGSRIIQIICADEALTGIALKLYKKYKDKDFDLIDATSFVVCKERKIKQVLTLDKHFSQMGFEILPSSKIVAPIIKASSPSR